MTTDAFGRPPEHHPSRSCRGKLWLKRMHSSSGLLGFLNHNPFPELLCQVPKASCYQVWNPKPRTPYNPQTFQQNFSAFLPKTLLLNHAFGASYDSNLVAALIVAFMATILIGFL